MRSQLRAVALVGLLTLAPALHGKDKKPADPNRKICRADAATGSIMPKQTCHTAAQWAQIDASMRDSAPATGDIRGQGGNRSGSGNGGN